VKISRRSFLQLTAICILGGGASLSGCDRLRPERDTSQTAENPSPIKPAAARTIPPLDAMAPGRLETATLALG
jgi:hypothetical protein